VAAPIRDKRGGIKLVQDGRAFRAQLVVPEQRQLYDGGALPCRADIKPTEIPRLLCGISIIEVAPSLAASRVRLAGTRLREIYDREITGLTLDDLDWREKRDYWHAAFARTIHEGLPAQGLVVAPRHDKEHLVQYWLRLPLAGLDGKVAMVLGYDHFMSAADRLEAEFAASA
jgi:hypothetical protein